MPQIVEKAVLTLRSGQKEMSIHLKPEFLGRLKVKISISHQQVMVKILTDTPLIKQVIESNIYQLKDALSSHGLQVNLVDVSVAQDSGQSGWENGNAHYLKAEGTSLKPKQSISEEQEKSLQAIRSREASLIDYFA